MKLYYPASFLKENDGRYSVSFSDVLEAITCGHDFENIDIKETAVKIELNLTGLDDKKTNFIIIKKSNESVKTESLLFYVYSKVFILTIKITITIFINKNSLIAIKDIDIITMTIFFTNIH